MTTAAITDLSYLEGVIERGMDTYLEVGRALATIKAERLFAQAGFANWQIYLEQRWGKQLSWASRHMSAVETVDALPGNTPRPVTESQARALREYPAEAHETIMRVAQRVADVANRSLDAYHIRGAGDVVTEVSSGGGRIALDETVAEATLTTITEKAADVANSYRKHSEKADKCRMLVQSFDASTGRATVIFTNIPDTLIISHASEGTVYWQKGK